jgi:hypothetical protein
MTVSGNIVEKPDVAFGIVPGIGVDVPWTEGGGLGELQSYAWIIVDSIYQRLATMSLFRGWTIRRINSLPIEAGIHIPFIGIFRGVEDMAGGDGFSLGSVKFDHTLEMGFQIVIQDNDLPACEKTLDRCEEYLFNQIFRNNELTNMFQDGLERLGRRGYPSPVQITGFRRAKRENHYYGTKGAKNETPIAQGLIRLSICFLSDWFATEFPDLERIALQTGWPLGGSPDDIRGVQQTVVTYDFDHDTGNWIPNPLPDDVVSPLPIPVP